VCALKEAKEHNGWQRKESKYGAGEQKAE